MSEDRYKALCWVFYVVSKCPYGKTNLPVFIILYYQNPKIWIASEQIIEFYLYKKKVCRMQLGIAILVHSYKKAGLH